MSLCSLFFNLLSFSPSFVFLPWVSRVARSGRIQLRSAGLSDKHRSLIWISFVIPAAVSYLSLCSFLFFIHSATDAFPPFSLSETHFLSPLPIKELAVLDWTRKVDFPSNCASTHFVLLLHRTKPTCCCKTELFVFLPFSSAPWLPWCLSYIVNLNPVKFSPHCSPLHWFHPVFTSPLLSYLLSTALPSTQLFLTWTAQEGRETQACRCFLQFEALFTVRRPYTGMQS